MSKPPTQIVVDRGRSLAGRRHGPGRSDQVSTALNDGGNMTATRDKFGRPIVVVTGMGVVTSLGAGKTDNWTKLTAGESGIRTITRFPTDGLKTTMAGTVDFVAVEPFSSTGLSRTAGRTSPPKKPSRSPVSARKGDFPGPLFLAVAPVEVEWPQRLELGRATGATRDSTTTICSASAAAASSRHITAAFCSARCAIISPRHSAPRDRRFRCRRPARPAPPPSSSASRPFAAAKPTPPCASATDGSVNPEALVRFSLLSALSTQNDPPRAASKPFSKNRDGFVMAEGAGALVLESYEAAVARGAHDPRRAGRLRRTDRLLPSHPLQPRRQADHRLRAQDLGGRRHDAGADRLHQRARHRDAGKRQDGISGDFDGVRRTRQANPGVVQQVDGRPHHFGSRRRRSDLFAADA